MRVIKFSFSNTNQTPALAAIDMSNWCKEHGLVHGQDYDWALITAVREVHFRFYSDSESLISMFVLKWAGYEVHK